GDSGVIREMTVATIQSDPTKAAQKLLDDVWAGKGLPVDPVRIARTLGISVIDANLSSDVSGALVKQHGQDPTILLNASDSRNRQRFSCAHEIGHYVKRSEELDEYEYVDLRGALAANGTDPDEIWANQFAAALLMPADEVEAFKKDKLTDIEMSLRFGVSREAMNHRLTNLNLA
ncbi:MAG: ImmA/IrrE family metallo-endopeptidase, partial [Solirubrobacteraceae bacterium]